MSVEDENEDEDEQKGVGLPKWGTQLFMKKTTVWGRSLEPANRYLVIGLNSYYINNPARLVTRYRCSASTERQSRYLVITL